MYRKNKNGFTLAELLIVVAIIAVLVAISIPIFTSQMTKAKIAADQANVRSAKAAAAAEYMSDNESDEVIYLYDGSKVINITSPSSSNLTSLLSKEGYGKTDAKDNKNNETGAEGSPKGGYVKVTVDGTKNNQIRAEWVSNISIGTGNLTKASLEKQLEDNNISKKDVIVFTASEGTTLDSSKTQLRSFADLFEGYNNLKVIDLSKAKLVRGDAYLFRNLPQSVDEIVLPQCDSDYNIYGKWYDENGNLLPPQSGSDELSKDKDSRVDHTKLNGKKIYRNPPVKSN